MARRGCKGERQERFPRLPWQRSAASGLFVAKDGFTTVGAAIAILLTCALIAAGVWVARSESRAAGVQQIADAAALAAENEVAEFALSVRVADAVLLTMSLTSIVVIGVGVVLCLVPSMEATGIKLVERGKALLDRRNDMADTFASALNIAQDALPLTAQLQAQMVIQENAAELDGWALGYMELVPSDGPDVVVRSSDAALRAAEEILEGAEDLGQQAEAAEQASKDADAALREGWLHDCGLAPDYCMYQRAATLAGMRASENPMAHSVNTWSFSMALTRAKAYYRHRLAQEAPAYGGTEEAARSALRKRFYTYAVSEMAKGYVHDDGKTVPSMYFPLLPRNTTQMKQTTLYTERAYPVSGGCLHAWAGCPAVAGIEGYGSLSQLDAGAYQECPVCQFDSVALGKVAAASTSIDNGFEYHYRKVAQAASDYCAARARAVPAIENTRRTVFDYFDLLSEALDDIGACRIEAYPPGRYGALVQVTFNANEESGLAAFFQGSRLGTFEAISASVLAQDDSENALSSLLDEVDDEIGSPLTGAGTVVLGIWGGLLGAYESGVSSVADGIEDALNALPFGSSSGLGVWAKREFLGFLEEKGLDPVETGAIKAVTANTGDVAARGSGVLSKVIATYKEAA